MTILTTQQIELLRAAAGAGATSDDAKMIRALIKRGLLIALPQAEGPSRLLITEAGRAAVAELETPPDAPIEPEAEHPAQEDAAPATPKGKLGVVIGLLKRPEGAAIAELMSATGWQAHSVRGAMSGAIKKKLGLTVLNEKTEAGRIYRIVSEAEA